MAGLASEGTIVRYDSTGSGSWVDIASVYDADGPSLKIGERDVTPLNPAGRAKAKIPTILDGGKFKLTLLLSNSEWNTLINLKFLTKTWRIVFTQGSIWECSAFWTDFSNKVGDAEADVRADIEFTITGLPTFTP